MTNFLVEQSHSLLVKHIEKKERRYRKLRKEVAAIRKRLKDYKIKFGGK